MGLRPDQAAALGIVAPPPTLPPGLRAAMDAAKERTRPHADPTAQRAWSFAVEGRPQGKGRPRFVDGRAHTPEATRRYERGIAQAARAAGVQAGAGPVAVAIDVYPPDRRRVDLDNITKAILDGLVSAGAVSGDHWEVVREVLVRVASVDKLRPRVEVRVTDWLAAVAAGEG